MDQKKTGKFIAQCRKEKGLTQAQLAEDLGISNRAVSKWETGKCCPDASLMLTLCSILGITGNELLSGERLTNGEEYQNKTEENMVEMQKQLQVCRRRLLYNNAFLLLAAVVSGFTAPLALIFIISIMVFRDYYLIRNLKSVKKRIEEKQTPRNASKGAQS